MKLDVNDKNKIVSLWTSNQEDALENIPTDVKEKIEEYRNKKYRICIYQLGNDDIKTNLLKLILNNAY